jgi:hypothetical protein
MGTVLFFCFLSIVDRELCLIGRQKIGPSPFSRPEGLLRGSFLVLTSIRGWIYHFFVMGDVVAKLNGT